MNTQKVTIRETCRKCEGKGVAHNPWDFDKETRKIGFNCPSCKGAGYTEYTYEPFIERKTATGVERVFAWPRDEFHTIDISQKPEQHLNYSVSYEAWLSGEKPAEWIETFYCPFDVFSHERFTHVYENPCSRCDKCRKKHPRRYMSDKSYMLGGSTHPNGERRNISQTQRRAIILTRSTATHILKCGCRVSLIY